MLFAALVFLPTPPPSQAVVVNASVTKKFVFGDVVVETVMRGSGETIVLIPGRGLSAESFAELAQLLDKSGYGTVAINPRGIEGVHRFLQRVWRELIGPEGHVNAKVTAAAAEPVELTKVLHETIKKVGDDIEGLRFNTAISQMMIFTNALQKAPMVSLATAKAFVQLLAPFSPHIAEELWSRLGGADSVMAAPWPVYDADMLQASEVKLVFQVNGRHRGDQLVPVGTTQEIALQLARENPKVAPHLEGKNIKRVIFVPGKIVNVVVE